MAKKQVNVRLGGEAMAALLSACESEGLTQAQAIEAALLRRSASQPVRAAGLQSAQLNRMEDALREIVDAVRRKAKPTSSTVPSTLPAPNIATAGEFSVQCAHCGSRFMGATKYASLCADCQLYGHKNVRTNDCRMCQQEVSI